MKSKMTAAEHAALDPSLQGHYTAAEDGSFDLFIEGAPTGYIAADQVAQLQSNTAGLNRKISELEAERDQAKTQLSAAQQGQQTAQGSRQPNSRASSRQQGWEAQAAQLTQQLTEMQAREQAATQAAAQATRNAALDSAADQVFVKAQYREDVRARALRAGWDTDDSGNLVLPNTFSQTNAGQPMGIEEYMASQRAAAPDLFNQAQPGGPAPGDNGNPGVGPVIATGADVVANLDKVVAGEFTPGQPTA